MSSGMAHNRPHTHNAAAAPTPAAAAPAAHQQQSPRAPEEKPEEKPSTVYHVVGPGAIWLTGHLRPAGTVVNLTPEKARELGKAVAPGPPRAERPADYTKRKAGPYRVVGEGSVMRDGVVYRKGDKFVVDTDAEAVQLGEVVEPAG